MLEDINKLAALKTEWDANGFATGAPAVQGTNFNIPDAQVQAVLPAGTAAMLNGAVGPRRVGAGDGRDEHRLPDLHAALSRSGAPMDFEPFDAGPIDGYGSLVIVVSASVPTHLTAAADVLAGTPAARFTSVIYL